MIEKFGDIEILIAPAHVPEEVQAESLIFTAAGIPPSMKKVVSAIAGELSQELNGLSTSARPDVVECELSLTLVEEAKAWVLGVKGEQTFKLKFSWCLRTELKA